MENKTLGYSGTEWRIAGLILIIGLAYMGYRTLNPPTVERFQGIAVSKMCDWNFKMRLLKSKSGIYTEGLSAGAALIVNLDLISEFSSDFMRDTGKDYFLLLPLWLDYQKTNGYPC